MSKIGSRPRPKLDALLQMRVPPRYLPAIAAASSAEDMSMSAWIRRALKSELLASGYGRVLAAGGDGATSLPAPEKAA